MFDEKFSYRYCPILSISPSEMTAIKELPEKDKDLILPVFPLKSWVGSNELVKSIDRIERSIGKDRKWIANIDFVNLASRPSKSYRQVHHDLEKLTQPQDGYHNWYEFIKSQSNVIPCLQTTVLSEFEPQLRKLKFLNRGVVLILNIFDLEDRRYEQLLPKLEGTDDLLVIIDLGQITRDQLDMKEGIRSYLNAIKALLPKALVSISSTSFPESFGGYYKGVNTIYERALFDKLKIDLPELIYSDRGSARASISSGGGGTPPPRIDYPCANEWNFIRMEFGKSDSLVVSEKKEALKEEKRELYTTISKAMMLEPYWESDLKLWATYIIELTSKGDDFGINSAQKATAVRINKHLYTQLHYGSENEIGDTDEDWVD